MTIKELEDYHAMPKRIEQKKEQIQSLRELLGIKSPNISGMPHGGGSKDRIGEIVPAIVAAEQELQDLESEKLSAYIRVLDWINGIDDLNVALCFSFRYLNGYGWKQIAEKMSSPEGKPLTQDAARKLCSRMLKKYCEEPEEL